MAIEFMTELTDPVTHRTVITASTDLASPPWRIRGQGCMGPLVRGVACKKNAARRCPNGGECEHEAPTAPAPAPPVVRTSMSAQEQYADLLETVRLRDQVMETVYAGQLRPASGCIEGRTRSELRNKLARRCVLPGDDGLLLGEKEVIFGGFLDRSRVLIDAELLARGTFDSCRMPSDWLDFDCLIHNHPTDEEPEPSEADRAIADILQRHGIGFWIINNSVRDCYQVHVGTPCRLRSELAAEWAEARRAGRPVKYELGFDPLALLP